ncbi:MAG TPA: hypothetical protein VIO11_06575 [Candidatus Methanoperedens sp.]
MNPVESFDLSTIIGLAGGIIGILGTLSGAYIWFVDRKNMKKATLYYPLYLACDGITYVIKNYRKLGAERSKDIFASSAKILDDIVYTHGSLVHLKNTEDLRTFLFMKKSIDEKFILIKESNLVILENMFDGQEFKEIDSNANALISICCKEVKGLKRVK